MGKSKTEKKNILTTIKKEEDIHSLLEELLPEMGLNNVIITHQKGGKSEDGKDLVCSFNNAIDETTEWWAFVVKKGAIKSNSTIIQDIKSQAQDCFDYEYINSIKKLRVRINKVKIVTNAHFSTEAERKIQDGLGFKNANIDFWDGEKLIALIDKHYPQYWIKGTKTYKKFIEHFNEFISEDNMSKTIGISSTKISRILDCAIKPKLEERIENEDGTFKWKIKDISSFINLDSNSIIVGEPGTGKSTLFKSLSKEIIEQNAFRNESEFYPILLNFNLLKHADFNLEQAVQLYFQSTWNCDLHIDSQLIIQTNSCVIFIDALDELPINEEKGKALLAINDFYKKHPKIRIICSSRPSDFLFYNCNDLGFKYLQISPLNKGQIKAFIESYFINNDIKSKRLLKSLKDTEILDKLPKTPMTLALIAILFDDTEVEIPATVTDLYRQFVDLLIGKYTQENTSEIIEVGAKHRMLCYLALQLHQEFKQSIAKCDLFLMFETYIKERGYNTDVNSIIDDLINNTGLLIINDKQEVQFKHLSFQEYFTAFEIFHHCQEKSLLFINDFNNLWWQNVALFYAGMTKDSPKLINDILDKSKPQKFEDVISNIGGIGRLLQALYNTPIESRKLGVLRGLENTDYLIQEIIEEHSCKINDFWRNFSKYQLMQIFGSWFAINHWSITLIEPLKSQFYDLLKEIDNPMDESQRFSLEFKLFLICSILATDDFASFEEFKVLVEKFQSNDLSLFAAIEMHFRTLFQELSEKEKNSETIKKIGKKICTKIKSLGKISAYVNVPIKRINKGC